MEALEKLMEISSRIDHLESAAEWIARETVHTDQGVSQTGTLICVLAEELREKLSQVFAAVEREFGDSKMN